MKHMVDLIDSVKHVAVVMMPIGWLRHTKAGIHHISGEDKSGSDYEEMGVGDNFPVLSKKKGVSDEMGK